MDSWSATAGGTGTGLIHPPLAQTQDDTFRPRLWWSLGSGLLHKVRLGRQMERENRMNGQIGRRGEEPKGTEVWNWDEEAGLCERKRVQRVFSAGAGGID